MKAFLSAALVLCLGLVGARPATADSIFFISPFSATPVDFIGMTPFDTSLGTLDSVHVNISGTLAVTGSTGLNLQTVAPGVIVPTPYSFGVDVTQDFEGLVGRYFDLEDHALFTFIGQASGTGEPFSLVTAFTYDVTFTSVTDLIGFAIPTVQSSTSAVVPPFSVSGQRADFFSGGPIDEIDLLQSLTITPFGPAGPFVASVASFGVIQTTYAYTPTPASVPEPVGLLVVGLAIASWRARRPQSARQ